MSGRARPFPCSPRLPRRRGLVLAAALLCGAAAPATAQRVFHVDFAGGNDAADGLSPASAWKRAPGDALATGRAKSTVLAAGDRVLFKGGVRYRGSIRIVRSGEPGKPIVYDGSGWGSTRAIIDGSNPAGASQPCPSQAACLGAPHWKQMRMVALPADSQWSDWLFALDEPLQLSQWPAIRDYWDYDDPAQMAAIPRAALAQLQARFIAVPGVPERLKAGSPVLGLWHRSNDIYVASTFAIQPGGITFDQPNYLPYTDRDNRFSILNAPSEVDAPGKFALSPQHGVAVYWPKPGQETAAVSVGSRRYGFLFGTASHVRIRGFSFANFASENHESKPNVQSGVPIMSTSTTQHVDIHDNHFRAVVNFTKMGTVRMARAQHLDVRRNHFDFMPWATAIYVSDGQGPANISCNSIRRIGRNGVRILNNFSVSIVGNWMEQVYGIHGAGINLYLDIRKPVVERNIVRNVRRAMTIQGHGGKPYFDDPTPPDWRITANQLHSTDPNGAALASWGNQLKNVRIEGNSLSNPRFALRFSGGEQNVQLVGNRIVGNIALPKGQALAENSGNMMLDPDGNGSNVMDQSGALPQMAGCS